MDWESRRRKRQEMGGAASGNTSANVDSSNSIADAWELRRTQRLQMDAGSEEARRKRSEEVDRINQARKDQRSLELAQDIALGIVRSVANHWIHPYLSSQAGQTSQMTAEEAGKKYKENQEKIAELNDEIKALEDTAKNRAGGSWYMGHAADRQPTKEEQDRIDSLKAERDALLANTTKYERFRKTQDDYYGVTQERDFGTVSKNRDFRNPTRDELSAYDARMNGATYIGADGKTYDVFGDVVDENYYTRFAQPEIVDRLGMFLGASEAEKDQAAGTPLDMEGTWEKVLKDGMDASWDQLSDQEIDIYYYLLNTSGQETADQYLDGMKTELNRRSTNERAASIDDATGLEKLALNLASVPANVFGGVAGFIEDTAYTLQGKEINPYSAAHSFSNDASAIRNSTAQDFNDMTGNGTFLGISLGDVYQSVMSGADSIVGGYTLGASGYGAAMGMGAATAEAKDLYEKGASKAQVAVGGLLAGVAEGFFEKYSIENLLSMKDAKSIGQLVKNMLVQGGIEFSEELNTELANTISDAIVMGSQSEWSQFIQQYMEDGKSKKEATALAMVDVLKNMWKSGVGGFISGFLLGGTGSVASYAGYQSDMRQQGQQILDSGNYDTLQALAMNVAKEGVYGKGESDLSRFAEKTAAGVKNLNENYDDMTQRQVNRATRNVGKLADRVDTVRMRQNAADIQSSLEAKGMSARDAKRAAQLISENYEGLVDPEDKDLQRVMEKPEVRETMKEITENPESSVAQRNYRYTLGLMGLKLDENGVAVPVRSKKEEPAAESVTTAEADKNASVEISDGVSGKMQGIKWDNGILTATVTTEAGETVSAPVEDVSMPSEMQDLVAVSKQFGESAPAVYAAYQPGMGVAEYGAAMKLASDYGYTGVSRSYADSSEYLNGLHPAQISIAYEAGQAAWTKESTETMRSQSKGTVFANRKAGKVSMKGGTVDGVTYKAVDRSGMTAQQKAAVRNITRLAQVTGINFVFYQSEKNSEGKYSGANGIYTDNTIFLDINAGATDSVTEAAILRTAAHELTHFIEQFSKSEYRALQEFMLKNLEGYKGKTIDQLVAEKQARSKKDMSFQDTMSEIVADGCEMMLQDTRIMELLASEHEGIAKKISRWLKNWVEDLKTAFTGVEAVHEEARAMIAHAEELQKLWDNALMQALRNREQNADTLENVQDSLTPGEEGTVYAENGDPVAHATEDGSVQLSMRTYEEEGRDAFRDYLEKCVSSKKLTKAEMQEMIDGIEEIYQVCKQFKDKYAPFGTWSDAAVVRDTYGKPVFSVVTPNGEYKMNLDFSLVCKKRRTLDAVFNEMSRRGIIDDFELGQKSVVKINEIIRKHGFETACALCFVDAKRFRQASMADSFVNLYNELVESLVPEDQRGRIGSFNFAGNDRVADVSGGIDTWSDSDLDFSHIDSVLEQYGKGTVEYKSAKYIKENAEARRLLQRGDFMSSKGFDAVKSQNRNILSLYNSKKGTGGPKASFGDVQYMNEVIRKSRHWTPAKAYAVGGVRIQSFSDYVPRMVFDYVQMVYDLAATKLPAHAYTKEALFAKQFGLTGVKINMSLIPAIAKGGIAAGLDANGDYVWAGESFDFETAKEIQNADGYTENCGTICVGVSDLHIRKLLSDPNIRMVIPYHKSGLNPIVAHMNRIAEFTDYTGSQNTLDKNGKKVEKDFDFNRALHKMGANGDPKAVVSEYLDWCDRQGYTPRFSQFRDNPNYYKLIEDFTLYDRNGQYVPQREVRAVFPTEGSAFGSMKDLIEAGLQEDAVIEGKRDKSISSIVDEIERTLPKTEAEIAETEVVQADHDLEGDIKYSDRNYSYEALTAKPDMTVTLVDDTAPKNRADIIHQAKKNAAGIGTFDPKTGSVSVRVNDINTDVILATNGLKHSMDRRTEVNGPVVVKAGEILQNSIRINELTPQKADAQESYVLIGAAQNNSGELYVVRSVINRFSNELSSMDVLYAINAKKESAALNAPRLADESAIRTDSTISISELLDYVNRYFPDVLPESVLKHYGYDARPEGKIGESALFQDRDTDSISNRAILANALESAAQNDIERKRLEEYRGKIDLLNSEEQKLQGLRSEIRELSFAKGPKDTKRIRSLQFEANQTANRINIIDSQLLRLEAAAPLQNVLQREKKLAYKRAEQKGKEALSAYREKATKTQREIISRYQESRAKGVESRRKTAMRHKIQNVVNELNQYLLNGNKDKRVMMGLKKAVAEALDAVNMDTVGAEERIAKLEQEMMKAKTPEKIQEIARKIDNIREMGDRMSSRLETLKAAYAEIKNSDDPLIANAHDEVIEAKLQSVIESVGDTPLRDMTLSQLEDVYDMYRMVLTNIRNSNKAFKAAKSQDIAVLGNNVMMEIEETGGKKKYRLAGTDGISRFDWNNLKPVYAFERIGSKTFAEIFNNVRTGEDTWALDVTEAKAFSDAIKKKYGYKKWNFDQTHSFQSTSGMEFNLNLEQIMSLYAYSKRDQALDHLQKGGIVFDPKTQVVVKTKAGIKVKYNLTEATAYNISEATLEDIVSKLTPEQKSFVDEMQDYLSTTMGEKGNEVSLELYGIKLFREKFYFPLKSASQFMAKAKEQQQGEVKIKNSGFSKETVQKANNPIVLSGFMDVWASHVNEMSMYHAFVLPMEDFYRVYNYRTPTSDTMATESVEMFLQNAYGKGATQYIDQLLKDLNGGARSDPRESAGKALVGRFKKAAVFASASVVIQQPSAVGRALALIDPKYFDFNPKLIQHKALWDEVKKYAPVAIIKEMGYFDTDMGMSTVDYIKDEKTLMDKADDVLSWAPAMADELTWCHIWTAVKRETQAKNPGLSIRSEEFLQKAGARFTEVIVKTQVYDSVLSRSANMRSKNLYMNMITSFMAEPTTSINMLQSAMWDLKRGYKGKAAKTIGAVVASVVLNSILVSFVYAGRDDDEDDTWLEKYASSLATELVEGINPITYIPIAKDIWSLLQGYDVERADMTLFSSVTKSLTKLVKAVSVDTSDMDEEDLADHRKRVVDASWGLLDAVMSMTGIPVKNVRRDVMAAINTYKTVNNGLSNNKTSFWNEIAESVKKSLPVWGWLPDNQKSDKLYDAIVSGDTAYQERVEALYDSQNAIDSARVKALRDNDPRILEAATAAFNGDPGERVRIAREIVAEGHFSQDDVIRAINAEINKLERAENGGSESEKSSPKFYDMNDYYDAVMIGDKSTADDAKEYYLDDRIAQGDSEEDALNSFKTSFTSTIKSEYLDGNIGKDKVMSLLTTYGGSSESESETYLKKWDFEDKYGYSWDQRDNAFRLGDITMDELVDYTIAIDGDAESAAKFLYEEHEIDAGTAANMLVTYSGMKSDDAKNKVAKWEFKNVYGFSYDDRREAYISGEISAYDLKKSLMDIGGMTSDEADLQIQVYDWEKEVPGCDNITAAAIRDYNENCASAGITKAIYYEAWSTYNDIEGDFDSEGKSIPYSKVIKVMPYINSLPLSSDQKTALALCWWGEKTVSKYRLW